MSSTTEEQISRTLKDISKHLKHQNEILSNLLWIMNTNKKERHDERR